MTRYYEDPATGAMLPSVTTILGMLPKPFLTNWAAKIVATRAVEDTTWHDAPTKAEQIDYLKNAIKSDRKAADVGTAVHLAIETGDWAAVTGKFQTSYEAFVEAHTPEIVSAELIVYDTPSFYAGTLDALATFDGDLCVVDWKTGRAYPEHWLQLEAYGRAASLECRPSHKALVHLSWDGSFTFEKRPMSVEEFAVFKALSTVFRWSESTKKKWES